MTKRKDPSELKERHRYPIIYDDAKKEEAVRILIDNELSFAETTRQTGIPIQTLRGFLNAHLLSLKARVRMEELAKLEDEPIEVKKAKYERTAWDAKMLLIENIVALAAPTKNIISLSQALRAVHWTTMEPLPDPGNGNGPNNSEANILAIVTNQILQIKQNINPNGTKNNRAVRNRKKPPRQSGG